MPKLPPSAPKKEKDQVLKEELNKFKHHTLHSGSPDGPLVKDPKQAQAIALSVAGKSKKPKSLKKSTKKAK